MFPFFETMAMKEGSIRNVFFHQKRMEETFKMFYPSEKAINLSLIQFQEPMLPHLKYKVKVQYNNLGFKFNVQPYHSKVFKNVHIKNDNQIDYPFKFTNRKNINSLMKQIPDTDQIIILKDDYITDSSYSNIVFYDGERWITPATPLLKGTMREYLLSEKRINEDYLEVKQLIHFKEFKFINAMNNLDEAHSYPMSCILY
ncbi:MAG: aminotransferase class IV [Bacteroidota bacterium]|nr:aminotransferase class IV [Bacteroidota bacterium]